MNRLNETLDVGGGSDCAVRGPGVEKAMPWAMSLLLHVAIGLLLMFVTMLVIKDRTASPVIGPIAIAPVAPAGAPVEQSHSNLDNSDATLQSARTVESAVSSRIIDGPQTPRPMSILGVNATGNRGGVLDGDGTKHGVPTLLGNRVSADEVVYVIDRSGSMLADGVFDRVMQELLLSIARLRYETSADPDQDKTLPKQSFHVIFFSDSGVHEAPAGRLVHATEANRMEVASFIRTVRAGGSTTALPALKRAFEVLDRYGESGKRKAVFLLTDGEFSGISGGSAYTQAGRRLLGNEAVVAWLRDHNRGQTVAVPTLLYGYKGGRAVEVMQTIARENNGQFKLVSHDE